MIEVNLSSTYNYIYTLRGCYMKKICTKCKVEKIYDEFGKVKKAFDGLNQQCKKCCNERARTCIRSPEAIANSRQTSLEWQKKIERC